VSNGLSPIYAIREGKDVLAVLPTGYCRLAILQAIPFWHQYQRSILALSLLSCQSKLSAKGIKACYLDFKASGATCSAALGEDDDGDTETNFFVFFLAPVFPDQIIFHLNHFR
jgi:hypothetical protein